MHKSPSLAVVVGVGSLLTAASASLGAATSATLFDSGGFEPSAGYTAGQFLAGQPSAASASNQWLQSVSGPTIGTTTYPFAAVQAYNTSSTNTSSGPNTQYVAVGDSGLNTGDVGYFYPNTNVVTPFTPTATAGTQVAVRWTMDVASAVNHPFFGITAFDANDANSANANSPFAIAGIDGTTGGVYGGSTTSSFTATAGTFYQYELLLNYTTQSYAIFEAPIVNGVSGAFTQIGSSPFLHAAAQFTDADISSFVVPGTNTTTVQTSGTAAFDNYSVQVPEPMSLSAVAGVTLFGLAGGRRRR